MVGMRSVSIA